MRVVRNTKEIFNKEKKTAMESTPIKMGLLILVNLKMISGKETQRLNLRMALFLKVFLIKTIL